MKHSSKENITLTEAAAEQAKLLIDQMGLDPEKSYLRVGLRGGGCSGFQYELDLDDKELDEWDVEFESHGVKVVTHNICMTYVNGTEIDYVDGIYAAGFKFINPNAKSTCGCNQSFSV